MEKVSLRYLSQCCNAAVLVRGKTTLHYECLSCETPCDVVDLFSSEEERNQKRTNMSKCKDKNIVPNTYPKKVKGAPTAVKPKGKAKRK